MADKLVVYGKLNCPQCNDLKTALIMNEKEYEYIDIGLDLQARDEIITSGFRSLPQIKKNGEWVTDFMEVLI